MSKFDVFVQMHRDPTEKSYTFTVSSGVQEELTARLLLLFHLLLLVNLIIRAPNTQLGKIPRRSV